MPKHYFRIKEHSGKKYLYKVRCERKPDKKYPVQSSIFIGEVESILKAINNG